MKKEPWVLIADGFHQNGGMDKANLALAEHLAAEGHHIHLVSYAIAPHLLENPLITADLVKRPLGSAMLAGPLLRKRGLATIRLVTTRHRNARVLTNGGNCRSSDMNWVHYVHSRSPHSDHGAPLWFRAKNRLSKSFDILSECGALRDAKLIIANSQRTRDDLINTVGIDGQKIQTVYLGAEPGWVVPPLSERLAAKRDFGSSNQRLIAVFVGALGLDNRKGFDVLFDAWTHLCAELSWDVDLIVAGAGRGLPHWIARTNAAGLSNRITFLGFTSEIPLLLAAADVLISPVRYEPYGLNVQEAICRGVPALVSESAGVAERYSAELIPMLIPDPENASVVAARLKAWRENITFWKGRFELLGRTLRSNTWPEMARGIVAIANQVQASGNRKLACRQPSQ